MFTLMSMGLFAIAAVLPTWQGEATPYFLAAIAILGGWLVAAPQIATDIQTINFTVILTDASAFWELYKPTLLREVEEILPPTELSPREVPNSTAVNATLAKWTFLSHLNRLNLGAALGVILAVLGLMVAPTLQTYHWGYWSPAALAYALVFSRVVDVVLAMASVVMVRTWSQDLQAIGAINEAEKQADGREPSASGDGPVQPQARTGREPGVQAGGPRPQ
ncbi:MAG: hypothetical protein ACYCYK_07080 [Candidatus Dormibacteria bacterium]